MKAMQAAETAEPVFVDTSVLVAIAFAEPDAAEWTARLNRSPLRFASPLLEAEFLSACRREWRTGAWPQAQLQFIYPSRALTPELEQVLAAGYLRGADCWHLATALFVAEDPRTLRFLTRDAAQRQVAERLGFAT